MGVLSLGQKFWRMISWMCPYFWWMSRIASSDSSRSATVSPMPRSRPVVNGILSFPASSIIARRTSGSFPFDPLCAGIRAVVSSISPMLAFTLRSRFISSYVRMPAFVCGRIPYSDAQPAHRLAVIEDGIVTGFFKVARKPGLFLRVLAESKERLGAPGTLSRARGSSQPRPAA